MGGVGGNASMRCICGILGLGAGCRSRISMYSRASRIFSPVSWPPRAVAGCGGGGIGCAAS